MSEQLKLSMEHSQPDGPRSELPSGWILAALGDVTEILDRKRVPVNATERAGREGNIPYYGATGQVGWIDDYLFDEELVFTR